MPSSSAAPDHWHAKMSIDAMESGKDVYCEKPMCHTIDEAKRITEAQARTKQIFTVGVQSTANPLWKMAHETIASGKIGHVMQGQTSYYRNSDLGQWRYYPLLESMNPKTVDWKMFLGTEFGLAPEQPFDRAKYAQWRCYWDFGGGMYTDLFVHQLTHLIQSMGVRFPSRVVGAGGLYLEYDGRDVPDVATVVADYDEGCQVIVTATMCNNTQIGEVIRGHTGTITFDGDEGLPDLAAGTRQQARPSRHQQGRRRRLHRRELQRRQRQRHPRPVGSLHRVPPLAEPRNPLPRRDRLRGHRHRQPRRRLVPLRQGLLLRQGPPARCPTPTTSWAKKWEKVSHDRGTPNQVMGWKADPLEGSKLFPRAYQKLEGDWVNGVDPAKKV